jgi:hypothetical protein
MSEPNNRPQAGSLPTRIIRWTARVGSFISMGFILALIIRDRMNPLQLAPSELLLFLCYPAAVAVGISLAWFWEFGGGILAVAGLVAFFGATRFLAGSCPRDWEAVALTVPGVLFLVSAVLRRLELKRSAASPPSHE